MKPTIEKQILQGLEEFAKALEDQQPIVERLNCRRVVLKLKPQAYDPAMVRRARGLLGASQAVFALFLGVSVKTVQAWEQGYLKPNKMACRFMDEIQRDPKLYRERLAEMASAK